MNEIEIAHVLDARMLCGHAARAPAYVRVCGSCVQHLPLPLLRVKRKAHIHPNI